MLTDREAVSAATPRLNKYIPINTFTDHQIAFLLMDCLEALFGGAAGPGKTFALLIAALQYVDCPGYSAVLFRRTYRQLALPKGLLDTADTWLRGTDAHWDGINHKWKFPSGAQLLFSHLEHEKNKYDHQSASYHAIFWDELTQFTNTMYTYLFSRLRKALGDAIPLRMRAATNPLGIGHDWVKARFIDTPPTAKRGFLEAKLEHNKFLDVKEYEQSLLELDGVTYKAYRDGNWNVYHSGGIFKRDWFNMEIAHPAGLRKIRYWDLAATEKTATNDPSETVGTLMGEKSGIYYVMDVVGLYGTPTRVQRTVKTIAQQDGYKPAIWIEQEPGSAPVDRQENYAKILAGWNVHFDRVREDKYTRALGFSAQAEHGNVVVIKAPWNEAWFSQLEAFTGKKSDKADKVDSATGAFRMIRKRGPRVHTITIP